MPFYGSITVKYSFSVAGNNLCSHPYMSNVFVWKDHGTDKVVSCITLNYCTFQTTFYLNRLNMQKMYIENNYKRGLFIFTTIQLSLPESYVLVLTDIFWVRLLRPFFHGCSEDEEESPTREESLYSYVIFTPDLII